LSDLLAAIGLILVLEGIAYGLFPDFMRRAAYEISRADSDLIRMVGLGAAIGGAAVFWFVRG
jgi:uncharacterized protein YjeT (DUF2065 family)